MASRIFNFQPPPILEEADSMEETTSPDFWLNSGAKFIITDGRGETIQGRLPDDDKWRLRYKRSSATDTGDGYYPQNLFRLVTKSRWNNFVQEMQFRITKVNLIDTPERDAWSGVFFFNRYSDGDNVYYTGLRVDGSAIIKKKIGGTYYTLKQQESVFSGCYDRDKNPNLIPVNRWIGIRSEVSDLANGNVMISLSLDRENTGKWERLLTETDPWALLEGMDVIRGSASAGIRTDYFDVQFQNYKLDEK